LEKSTNKPKPIFAILGLLILFAAEILRVYFIMPFPGSQHANTIGIAYFIDRYILLFRVAGWLILLPSLVAYFRKGKKWQQIILSVFLIFYVFVFYLFNFKFLADKMFYQPQTKRFADLSVDSTARDKLVIGVAIQGDAKAYPIEIIGYHHQVKDTLGGQPIMVTYCTVCRTGRVYSPFVNGKYELFRLVGMDHFNAMFEDATTKSWWQQATGRAIAGSLKGSNLPEIPSAQMRLGDWLILHPNSLVLQPDPHFLTKYDSLSGYDQGTISGSLEKRDTASWKFKSWVIGVSLKGESRAYDWNMLVRKKLISDTIANTPILLTIEPNMQSFYVFTPGDSLHFVYDTSRDLLRETVTKTSWQPNGLCIEGNRKGERLVQIQSYQEFWHSWRTFHPNTSRYGYPGENSGVALK
jgi:Protein of unknown function (DUF3179)